jgi:hypothetical protein
MNCSTDTKRATTVVGPPSPARDQARVGKRARDIQEEELHHMLDVSCDISEDEDVGPRRTWVPATDGLCSVAATMFHEWVRKDGYRFYSWAPKKMFIYNERWGAQNGAHFYIQQLMRALTTTSKSLLLLVGHVWSGQGHRAPHERAFNWSKGAQCTLMSILDK